MRAISNSVYVALAYLSYHWLRTLMLTFALALIGFAPWFINQALQETQKHLSERATTTPLVLGAKGSALELVLSSLYFDRKSQEAITLRTVNEIKDSKLAYAIPFNSFYHAGDFPIIGTNLDYFDFRQLTIKEGRQLGILGEAVIGANVAAKSGFKPGDKVISSPDNLFDISGSYPLLLSIVGVLAKTGSADDDAIFVDIRSTWIIAGLGHGHQDLAKVNDPTLVQEVQKENLIANANLQTYTVIDRSNLSSFHFHGDDADFPLSSALVIPKDEKSTTLLLGRYQGHESLQLLEPKQVVTGLLDTMFRIKRVLDVVVGIVILSTLLTIFLVMVLSLRLRARELSIMSQLGGSRTAIAGFVLSEFLLIALLSLSLAGIGLALSELYREQLIMQLIAR
ncbi:MAG: ABC transporter permease [Trueperaceae bacterium]|nr:ABC transporter permease [Trueperaceae bacterium]